MFYAIYVTGTGVEWREPLCVCGSRQDAKDYFIKWYSNKAYMDLSIRFAKVEIKEIN